MIDLNRSRNQAVRPRAGRFHVLFRFPALVAALERQSLLLFGWLLLATPVAVQAQFIFTTTNGSLTLTRYIMAGGAVNIPSATNGLPITSIGEYAFYGTSPITVAIPDSVTSLGRGAFSGCTSLTSVTIGNGLTSIGDAAFLSCTNLRGVYFQGDAPSLGSSVFDNANNATAYYSLGTTGWDTTFSGRPAMLGTPQVPCAYTTDNGTITITRYTGSGGAVSIPSTISGLPVINIGAGAFSSCASVTSVTIPGSVTSLGDYAFENCVSLTGVYLQGNAPSAGSLVFDNATNATVYYLAGTTGWGTTFGGVSAMLWNPEVACAYTTDNGTVTISRYTGSGGAVSIAGTISGLPVIGIGSGAFSSCSNVTSVTIPGSVTSLGDYVFIGCAGLATITVDALNPAFSGADGVLFDKNQTVLIQYPSRKGGAYTIPASVTSIRDLAFEGCTSLTSITIPSSVTGIRNYAFENCVSLKGLYFQGNAPSVGSSVFDNANSATVYYLAGTTGWGPTFGGLPAMLWSPEVPCTYTIINGTITITKYTGSGGAVTIPGTIAGLPVTSIGDGAFYECSTLTGVTIPSNVTSIGDGAFQKCTSLAAIAVDALNSAYISADGVLFNKSQSTLIQYPEGKGGNYTIPNSVSYIGSYAFSESRSLTSVTVPTSVLSIGDWAFWGCTSLTGIYFRGNAPGLGLSVFDNAKNATVYYLLGSAGWDTTFGGLPATLWNPELPYAFTTTNGTTVITRYTGSGGGVSIPSTINGLPVTGIGNEAFRDSSSLTSVTIPYSVTSIGYGAFSDCTSLTAITVDTNNPVYSSADGVLFNKSQSTLVQYPEGKAGDYTIPSGVASIGDYAFENCASLTSLTIPGSVTSIGYSSFENCTGLSGVYFQGNSPSLGDDAFNGDPNPTVYYLSGTTGWGMRFGILWTTLWDPEVQCAYIIENAATTITKYTGPGGAVLIPSVIAGLPVTSIGVEAFRDCIKLRSVTIPNTVTSIRNWAFYGCSGLTNVTIPNSVTTIRAGAFLSCTNLTGVAIPESVTSIEGGAFGGCTSLATITVDPLNSAYSSMDGVLFNKILTTLIQYPSGKAGAYAIPNTVTSIGGSAFGFCTGLTSVTIPDSVTSIGDGAFYECTSLDSVTLPSSVTRIGDYAFRGCTSLTTVTIPDSVTSLGNDVFIDCPGLLAITVDALSSTYSSVDGVLFDQSQTTLLQYPGSKTGAYTIPDSVTSIRDAAFAFCLGLTSVIIPDTITSIGNSTFSFCTNLTSVTIPNSVTNIGWYAFENCPSLTRLSIPRSVATIEQAAFYGCTSLTAITVDALNSFFSSVDGVLFNKSQTTLIQYPQAKAGDYAIPGTVSSIGGGAFEMCSGLAAITVDALNSFYSSVGGVLFDKGQTTLIRCPGGKVGAYTVPNGVSYIGNSAFSYCGSLTSVTIPQSLTYIGPLAFSYCTSLRGVYFQGNAPSLSDDMFDGGDTTVYYLAGSKGWGAKFANRPTARWNPQAQVSGASFGVTTNQFGFNITWASGKVVVVEACTDLANPVWSPLQTNTLSGDSFYFSDPQWTNYPARFYRIRSP